MTQQNRIFLGTILLERNRWSKENRSPSYRVSDWTARIRDDGFDGLELWELHGLMVDDEERERLRTGPVPVALVNSYASCEPEDEEGRRRTAELAAFFDAEGMKFNFGREPAHKAKYIAVVREWATMFKPGFRMLSENHRGTITDDVEVAADVYRELHDVPLGAIIHFQSDETAYRERFGTYGDRLTHIHCSLSGEDGPMPEIEVCRRLEWLREFGFNGTFTMEFTEGVRGGLGIEELYRNAVRDLKILRRCLEKVG
ncbi:MAG: sugar phosphate isomerase/epimerase [Lentisphaerae bacterium]|nr:MAG: sugar phosphate isomerase/epimerase [Lentisphaerota bacterium]